MTRRDVLTGAAGAVAASALAPTDAEPAGPTPQKLPRWRGFNLLEKFMVHANQRFQETDFIMMHDWGFDFARLPMDYRCWTDAGDWTRMREDALKEIDEAVQFGQKHRIHINLNFHRAPGYTVASPAEPKVIWTDTDAQRACCLHWAAFARRYRGIPNACLSFNLFNEPSLVSADAHRTVVSRVLDAIRAVDPDRLVICDGRMWGNTPPTELIGLGVAAATRGYQPMPVTHWKANWVAGSDRWPEPTYPMTEKGKLWGPALIQRELIVPWKDLEARGQGVIVGEFGAFNQTPHRVVMAWMREMIGAWRKASWGYAMWNLRGSFGILDSDRSDVNYKTVGGHKLDKEMLDLLLAH